MNAEVTAVVPTIGEQTLDASLASLAAQSHPLADVVVVRDVHPFPEAMNQGVRQVKTPFMLQCDADMILHPDCVETLLSAMDETTGVSIGYLHDELLGDIQAVKLYRTECLRVAPFEDRIAADSDGIEQIVQREFRIAFAGRRSAHGQYAPDVLGLHRPDYSDPHYVFQKYSVMGSIVRDRNSYREYRGVLAALKASRHEMADVALTAFCHGLFSERRESAHKPLDMTEEFRFFSRFREGCGGGHDLFAITRLPGYDREADLIRFNGIKNGN
jgi:glycosyltransferase involved in cell wall biosynthesis